MTVEWLSDCCYRKAVQGSGEAGAEGAAQRIRSTPDWGQTSVIGDHLWSPSNASGDFCYVGEGDCTVSNCLLLLIHSKKESVGSYTDRSSMYTYTSFTHLGKMLCFIWINGPNEGKQFHSWSRQILTIRVVDKKKGFISKYRDIFCLLFVIWPKNSRW